MRKVSWFRFPHQSVRALPTTAVAPTRGALLTVALALFALPALAQGVPEGMDEEGGNPMSGTCLPGSVWNGLTGQCESPPGPTSDPSLPGIGSGCSYELGGCADDVDVGQLIDDFCAAVRAGEDGATILAAIYAIAKKNPFVFIILESLTSAAEATCNLTGN